MSLMLSLDPYDLNSLSHADQELFSLFLQHPELQLGFDHEDAAKDVSKQHTTCEGAKGEALSLNTLKSKSGGSLFHTGHAFTSVLATPSPRLKSIPLGSQCIPFGTWSEFVKVIQSSGLPAECLQYYTSLGKGFVTLRSTLSSMTQSNEQLSVPKLGKWLLKNISFSCEQATVQVQKISELKSLVAFNTRPSPTQLWSTYLQRAKLIVKSITLPSKHELLIIRSLVLLYNFYVYSDFIKSATSTNPVSGSSQLLDELYDSLMTWLSQYQKWCRDMANLKKGFIQPLVEQLLELPEAHEDFNDFRTRIAKARCALKTPMVDRAEMADMVVQNLNLSARKPGPTERLKRVRTRYKREHTV